MSTLPETVHELTLRNQVLVLHPPLAQARVKWLSMLEQIISVVGNLPRIKARATMMLSLHLQANHGENLLGYK